MSVQVARSALAEARLERASALLAVREGMAGMWDIIESAGVSLPLGKIKLHQLLLAAGRSRAASLGALRRTLRSLRLEADPKSLTLDWLTDPRAAVRRQIAFADALNTQETPWRGFPFTPPPHHPREEATRWL